MNNPTQNEAETEELKYEKSFRFHRRRRNNERTNMSMKDPDTMLSMIVLLLTCLALAAPGARICLVAAPRRHHGISWLPT